MKLTARIKRKTSPLAKLVQMVAHHRKKGPMLAFIPVGEDPSDLLNDETHLEVSLPIEPKSPI